MFNYVIKKMVGTKNQRELRKMQPAVARINEREAWAKGLSDEQIREQVRAWQKEVADAAPKDKSEVLYRGIAARAFERAFQLADFVVVKSASLENGLLHVDLVREIPEAKKPRNIPISTSAQAAQVVDGSAEKAAA